MRYPFQKLFLVCTGERCNNMSRDVERGECIAAELKDLNKKAGRKSTVRVCRVSCLDLCDHGPNMIAQPGHTVYSHLTRALAIEAYRGEMEDGPRRSDLELKEDEFRAGTSAAARK
ncbi:MAG TPA: (2Fe-2S) ferredoxin domain-containing protein [Thermoanaerobaculia bacterium]|nr:(2Fe-2S) ferredoxin domain-containing protein [Thermoanaerobaculia bacterium]